MLASSYRFLVNNQTGDNYTDVTVEIYPWKFGSDGALTYGTKISKAVGGSVDHNTQAWVGTTETNTEWLGAHIECTFELITPAGSGDIFLYLCYGPNICQLGPSEAPQQELLIAETNPASTVIFQAEI